MSNAVIVDTDALLAIVNAKDVLHGQAKAILVALYEKNYSLLVLPTTLSEFALLAAHYVGLEQTRAVIEVWTEGANHLLLEIDDKLSRQALEIFSQQTSKKESLFDCYVMSASRKYNLPYIFSFDKGYKKKKNGFKLTEDIFPNLSW